MSTNSSREQESAANNNLLEASYLQYCDLCNQFSMISKCIECSKLLCNYCTLTHSVISPCNKQEMHSLSPINDNNDEKMTVDDKEFKAELMKNLEKLVAHDKFLSTLYTEWKNQRFANIEQINMHYEQRMKALMKERKDQVKQLDDAFGVLYAHLVHKKSLTEKVIIKVNNALTNSSNSESSDLGPGQSFDIYNSSKKIDLLFPNEDVIQDVKCEITKILNKVFANANKDICNPDGHYKANGLDVAKSVNGFKSEANCLDIFTPFQREQHGAAAAIKKSSYLFSETNIKQKNNSVLTNGYTNTFGKKHEHSVENAMLQPAFDIYSKFNNSKTLNLSNSIGKNIETQNLKVEKDAIKQIWKKYDALNLENRLKDDREENRKIETNVDLLNAFENSENADSLQIVKPQTYEKSRHLKNSEDVVSHAALPDPDPVNLDFNAINSKQTRYIQTLNLHCEFGVAGPETNCFNMPHGLCLSENDSIAVADSINHRIQIFDKHGHYKLQFGSAGRTDGFLWYPRKVAYLPIHKYYVVCDRSYQRSRMQIFSEEGNFIKRIPVHFISIISGIAIAENENIVLVDSVYPTIFIFREGELLRTIDCKPMMEEPSDIACKGDELYLCDFKGHKVVVYNKEGACLRSFGSGDITIFPNCIEVFGEDKVLIGNSHGNFFHIAVYTKWGRLLTEYKCPHTKVSRCCGLVITSTGKMITVDKNYNHVLIFDPIVETLSTFYL